MRQVSQEWSASKHAYRQIDNDVADADLLLITSSKIIRVKCEYKAELVV